MPTGTIQVQDGIDHFAHVSGARMPTGLGGWNERLEDGPFLLTEITWITSSLHLPPLLSLPSRVSLSCFTPPVSYHSAHLLAEPLTRPLYRPSPPSSGFSRLCTQPLILQSHLSPKRW